MTKKDNIQIFKALGEQTRYNIIECLLDGERCACEIPSIIKRTQSNTSMHLSKLLDWGIIKSRRDGKRILYTIKNKKIKQILKIIQK